MNTEDNKIIESTDIETQNTVHQQENSNITEITDTNISEVTSVIETPQVVESKPKNNKILLIILLFIFFILIVVSIIVIPKLIPDKNNQLDTNIQEPSKNEIKEEQKDNKDEIVEEPPPIEEQQKPEEPQQNEENNQEEQNKENDKNNNSTNKPSNNTNNQKPNNNNTPNNNDTNNNTPVPPKPEEPQPTPEPEPIQPEVTIVNTKSINLNEYDTDIKIINGGEYTLTGTLNHSLYIETNNEVTLKLNNVKIKSKTDSAIANLNTNSLVINLSSGTKNEVSDGIVESDYDGCIFSNGNITIQGTGSLTVYGNQIDGEGIATKNSPILINGGNISIYTTDDGLNTGGTGGTIEINNGNIYIEAGGDGIDSNQDIIFNGGTTFVTGGSSKINGGLDADGKIEMNGGQVIALGSDQLQIPNTANQTTLCLNLTTNLTTSIKRGTLLTILDENDNVIVSFKANDNFRNMIISTNTTARNFTMYTGGTNTGTKNNGVYSGGTYTKGTMLDIQGRTNFEIYDTITKY